ncbi:MAG: glycosyltransferase family 2 protein [Gammaproteobacteria bacterium]|nr:glycosyltransferase family 2 protein [Gammaproteobacteria bacterium]
MNDLLLITLTLVSGLLVVYHHLGYPLVLRWARRRRPEQNIEARQRRYVSGTKDRELPTVTIVVPAFNEQRWIAEKIRNLAVLDYPPDCLRVIIGCDGCTDNTAVVAAQTAKEAECRQLQIDIHQFSRNRGKVAVINEVIQNIESELVVLSDVSALSSVDALLIAAERFKDPGIGVLNSHYRLLNPGSSGEAAYWNYQSNIKASEAALGSTLGAHGAFYMFRRSLFQRLAQDTINDDFILPMEIVAKGYRAEHESRITALELEQADQTMDQQRRRRIAAGNLQQLLRLKRLLLPRYGSVAFAFASGKGLRVLMPFLMLATLFGSLLLATEHPFFALMAAVQLLVYALAAWYMLFQPRSAHRHIRTLAYLVSGHLAGMTGTLRYLLGLERGRWSRATSNISQLPTGGKT